MLLLPAAALCCLCSVLVAMAAELVQRDVTLTRRAGQSVSFSCGGTDPCYNNYVSWYQKKETETVKFILEFRTSDSNVYKAPSHPQKHDFSAEIKPNGYQEPQKPVVSVYPAASRAHLEGKTSLLCLASDMFPPEVRFSWKRQEEELSPADGEQLELRESGRTASILVLHSDPSERCHYSCSVQHEGGPVDAATPIELPAAAASCPPEREPAQSQSFQSRSFQSELRVKLLCLLYSLLIVKSLVYCCGLSLLMILTNKGASTN